MLFVTREFFLVFLPIVLAIFHTALALGLRKLLLPILLAASAAFYAWGTPQDIPVLCASILINYYAGRAMAHWDLSPGWRKATLVSALVFDLGLLAFFKYANFLFDNIGMLTGERIEHLHFTMPVGISFYTFTQIAFLVDVYKQGNRVRDLASYSLFVTYFPHLIAGPIIHWKEVMPQFRRLTHPIGREIATPAYAAWLTEGICLFAIGMLKKLLSADQLAVFVDLGYTTVPTLGFTDAWLLSLAYTFQLYFDFSGYADMAIGISLLFGIRLPLNFNSPYRADSIQDFWRRWHMTLSRWLRDYLYIPLGGNRFGTTAAYRNVFVTFLLGGLWHGAAWTFIIWGALHGLGCCVQRWWSSRGYRMPAVLAVASTFLFVNMTWVYFRAPDVATANALLLTMAQPAFVAPTLMYAAMPLLLVGALMVWLCPNSQTIASTNWRGKLALSSALAGTAAMVAMVSTNASIPSPFIYYNF